MALRIQTEALEAINATTCLPEMFRQLVDISEAVRNATNTTMPILPNDIPVILNFLKTILK